jgi:hypothetical protein
MALDVQTLLTPPDGTGELEVRWFDWLPAAGSGQTQKEAVLTRLDGYRIAAESLLEANEIEVTDEAVTPYVYWKAYESLALEYGRRVGSTTIHNEVTQAVGAASAKPFADARDSWKSEWNLYVPDKGIGGGQGSSASVPSSFRF